MHGAHITDFLKDTTASNIYTKPLTQYSQRLVTENHNLILQLDFAMIVSFVYIETNKKNWNS